MKSIFKLLSWGMAVLVVMTLANMAGNYMGKTVNTTQAKKLKAPSEISVVVTRQANGGLSEDKLDRDVMNGIETWILDSFMSKYKKNIEANGGDVNKLNLTPLVESNVVESKGRKLAIFKVSANYSTNLGVSIVKVMGFEGNEIVFVNCIRPSPEPVPVFVGVCGDKIREVYGFTIN